MDECVEQGLAERVLRHGEGFKPVDTPVADGRLEVFGQQDFHRHAGLSEEVAMHFVMVNQIRVTAEEADLDVRSGDELFRVGMK